MRRSEYTHKALIAGVRKKEVNYIEVRGRQVFIFTGNNLKCIGRVIKDHLKSKEIEVGSNQREIKKGTIFIKKCGFLDGSGVYNQER